MATIQLPSTITIDTNLVDARELVQLARDAGIHVAIVSTSSRELTPSDIRVDEFDIVLEILVLNESFLNRAVLASQADVDNFEAILHISSNGSFPCRGDRGSLSAGERRQLRDAQILTSHVAAGRDVFVTDDRRGFISHGRLELLESRLATRILTGHQLREICSNA